MADEVNGTPAALREKEEAVRRLMKALDVDQLGLLCGMLLQIEREAERLILLPNVTRARAREHAIAEVFRVRIAARQQFDRETRSIMDKLLGKQPS